MLQISTMDGLTLCYVPDYPGKYSHAQQVIITDTAQICHFNNGQPPLIEIDM